MYESEQGGFLDRDCDGITVAFLTEKPLAQVVDRKSFSVRTKFEPSYKDEQP